MTTQVMDMYDTLSDGARARELRAYNKERLAELEADQEAREARLAKAGWEPGAGTGCSCCSQ